MKGNSIVKNVILVMIITSVMILVLSFRAMYAATIDLNSSGFESIGSGSNDGNLEQDPTPAAATPKNNVVENNIIQNNTTEKNNTTNKSSSSANESQLPATGSNTEIIFAVGVVALVGIVAVIYKKANIKID